MVFSKKKYFNLFLLDIIAFVSPIGIFFGRIANFINGELVGKTTDVFWGVIFPYIDNNARHPSQLYEAFLEGVVLFIIMNLVLFRKNYKTGTCSYIFLIFYGIFRIFSEFYREPDLQVGYLFNLISMGTMLSILMVLAGSIIFLKKMISNKNFFNNFKVLPVDKFIENVLYDKKFGYYSSNIPFGKSGDFITAPGISNLFSEIIGIWFVATWNTLGKPKKFNIVELGPGDGSLTKVLLKTFKKFPDFNRATSIFLYEKSNLLKNLQNKYKQF